MTEQEVSELAAFLVDEHGNAALEIAQGRRDQYARERQSDAYRLWARITAATARLLRARRPEEVSC